MKFRSSLLFLFFINPAFAADCPAGAPSCKVLTLTPDEEAILIQPRGILDTAATGRQLDLGHVAAYFRSRIEKAPSGNVAGRQPDAVPVPTPDPRK